MLKTVIEILDGKITKVNNEPKENLSEVNINEWKVYITTKQIICLTALKFYTNNYELVKLTDQSTTFDITDGILTLYTNINKTSKENSKAEFTPISNKDFLDKHKINLLVTKDPNLGLTIKNELNNKFAEYAIINTDGTIVVNSQKTSLDCDKITTIMHVEIYNATWLLVDKITLKDNKYINYKTLYTKEKFLNRLNIKKC